MTPDPFLRWHLAPTARLWRAGGATAAVVLRGDSHGLLGLGAAAGIPTAVADAADTLRREGVAEVRLSLPPGTADADVPGVERVGAVSDWEWMWTERQVATSSDADWVDDDAALTALLEHSPRAHAQPGDADVRRWAGVRRDGALVAAGALCSAPAGTPHLRAIVTHPDHRGHGLGTAVTAFLSRHGLLTSPVVTLGMYADNAGARRIYHQLGFVTSHHWRSSLARLR